MDKKASLALILSSLLVGSAHAAAPQWAWTAGKQNNDGSISLKSVVNPGDTVSLSQNPTGAASLLNTSVATQPPVLIMSGSAASTISGAIQLNSGYVYVKDSAYNTWIQVPNATFTSQFNYSNDTLTGNAWRTVADSLGTISPGRSFNGTLACNPGPSVSGTSWGLSVTYPTSSIVMSGQTIAESGEINWQPSGPSYPGPNSVAMDYRVYTTLQLTWGAMTINKQAMALAYSTILNCGGFFAGKSATYSGTLNMAAYNTVGITPAGQYGLLCLYIDPSSFPFTSSDPVMQRYYTVPNECVVGNKMGTTKYTLGISTSIFLNQAGNNSTSTWISDAGQFFYKDGATLYAIDYVNDRIDNLGNIGGAIPTGAYMNVTRK